VYDALRLVFDRYDLLVAPTLSCLAVDNAADGNTLGPAEVNGEKINRLIGWCMTFLINFNGHPAASCPAGLAENGMPVGLQIAGRRYDDYGVIAASAALERVRPWMGTYKQIKI
jgi:amidase/aspartyl-tRNA(Asn)/glutamyl-tRNA(Gln) amidotransferase subunit A